MKTKARKRRLQFPLVSWIWITLILAAFFLGRGWDSLWHPASTEGRIMLGAGVNSDAGVTGTIVIDESNFSTIPSSDGSN